MYASTARPSERKDLAASWNLNVRLAISIQNSSTLQLPLTDKVNVIYGTFDREGEDVRLTRISQIEIRTLKRSNPLAVCERHRP